MIYILRLFSKRKTRPSLFSAALSEGIKDVFIEMGYHLNDKNKG
ncbi:MAG: hypothetical protein ACXVC7_17215 [Bacteroidia bacterium]